MSSLPAAPIWVMEDRDPPMARVHPVRPGSVLADPASTRPRSATPATAIAGRLGPPFRRIGEDGPDAQVAPGSLPTMILCCGQRSAARALLHKARHGGLVVHCLDRPSALPHRWLSLPFDLLVAPQRGGVPRAGQRPGNVVSSIGAAQPVSPALLNRARLLWRERLDHLPWPRISLVMGGGAPDTESVARLAAQLAALMRARGGCILATALSDCPPVAVDVLAAGLAGVTHLLHRSGEPGADPQLGFLGSADAVLVAWAGPAALSEACAADGPVFVMPGGPARARDLTRLLLAQDQVRVWPAGGSKGSRPPSSHGGASPRNTLDPFSPWPRVPLDEAGRIAGVILGRTWRLWNRSLEPDRPEQA